MVIWPTLVSIFHFARGISWVFTLRIASFAQQTTSMVLGYPGKLPHRKSIMFSRIEAWISHLSETNLISTLRSPCKKNHPIIYLFSSWLQSPLQLCLRVNKSFLTVLSNLSIEIQQINVLSWNRVVCGNLVDVQLPTVLPHLPNGSLVHPRHFITRIVFVPFALY